MSDEKPAWMNSLKQKKQLKKATTSTSTATARAGVQIGIKGKHNLKKTTTSGGGMSDYAKQQYRLKHQKGESFVEKLDEKSLEYFNEVCTRTYSEQCQFFLNAFWEEFGDQAEIIYSRIWETFKSVEMANQGISYRHLYMEGFDLDFDMGLRAFEVLDNYFKSPEGATDKKQYPAAVPEFMTAIVRKKELRNKVDVNFDGRVGMLEFLLYLFKASPKVLMERSQRSVESNPELDAARAALAEVNRRIRAYEAEKARLEKIRDTKTGVKRLGAINMLAQIESGPLMEQLRAALITAEAKVRIVAKKYKISLKNAGGDGEDGAGGQPCTNGTIWWMEREILEKKRLYGRRAA